MYIKISALVWNFTFFTFLFNLSNLNAAEGIERFVQVLDQPAEQGRSIGILQYDLDHQPLTLINLQGTDHLDIDHIRVNGFRVLLTGRFKGDLNLDKAYVASSSHWKPFYLLIDETGELQQVQVLEDVQGKLGIANDNSGDFHLLGYQSLDAFTLQVARWRVGTSQLQRELAESKDVLMLEIAQSTSQSTPPPPLPVPMNNPEDPEG